ncbi:MAG: hypothetical protein PWR30_279 [Candidatus Woesearchaeota archaeon]|nr:hypothetical protein [Candidatus Woesearchaeota archaeon]
MVILFDRFNIPDDIYEIVFSTKQQAIVAKALVKEFKEHGGELTKTEMSLFATSLHDGNLITEIDEPPYIGKKVKLSYNKRQFYDRIITPMRSMGMIYLDLYKKKYTLSDEFSTDLHKIGILWKKELQKPLGTPIKRKNE